MGYFDRVLLSPQYLRRCDGWFRHRSHSRPHRRSVSDSLETNSTENIIRVHPSQFFLFLDQDLLALPTVFWTSFNHALSLQNSLVLVESFPCGSTIPNPFSIGNVRIALDELEDSLLLPISLILFCKRMNYILQVQIQFRNPRSYLRKCSPGFPSDGSGSGFYSSIPSGRSDRP